MADMSGASAAAGRAMAAAMRLRGRATGVQVAMRRAFNGRSTDVQLVRQRVCSGRSTEWDICRDGRIALRLHGIHLCQGPSCEVSTGYFLIA